MTNGNEVPGAGVPPVIDSGQPGREINRDPRMWAMFCHLAALATFVMPGVGLVVGPLVVWLIKKEQYPFVDEQGKEAVNFQISMLIYFAIGALLLLACGIGVFVMIAVGVLDLVFMIIAAIKANEGYHYRYPYPFIIHFVK
jgi:uncharacterized Tic20 family protein